MDVLQSWLVVGVPGLVVVVALFAGRSKVRAQLGFVALAALVMFFLVVPVDVVSAAALGLLAVVLLAAGRGTNADDRVEEHHQQRTRWTRAAGD